jgi:hypothetical protein
MTPGAGFGIQALFNGEVRQALYRCRKAVPIKRSIIDSSQETKRRLSKRPPDRVLSRRLD